MTELDKLDGLTAEDIAEINALFSAAEVFDNRLNRNRPNRGDVASMMRHRQEDDYEDRMYEEAVEEWRSERE